MDSEVHIDGQLIDIIDEDWITDELPLEDIQVPLEELPDLEQVLILYSKHFDLFYPLPLVHDKNLLSVL